MMEISLLTFEDMVLSCVSGVLDIFTGVNRFLEESGKPPAFKLDLVMENPGHMQLSLPGPGISYKSLAEVNYSDLIIAPAFYTSPDIVLRKNRAIIDWIREMRAKGTEVASLCLGSYFLAEAGVLAGKSCTSHWMAIEDMRQRYPDVKMLADMVMTDEEGTYTSGGAFSSLNLVLYLVEKFCGREVEVWASKMFSIDMDRVSQAHFAVFQGQRKHEDEEILKAQNYIEQHYHLPISVEQIAEQTNMSKRNFIRRFKSATKNTPLEYLQRVKIESAKKELEKNAQNISSLIYSVGYNDVKTFREVFKRITGITPQDYRKKYCRTALEEY